MGFLNPIFILDVGAAKDGLGGDGPLLDMLHEIWQLMRDLVNVMFAVLLVVGAIMTIVQANTETVKNYRVKFILAVVLVNFSWFVPRVILDVSQVLTYTVYQIPSAFRNGPNAVKCTLPGLDDAGNEIPCIIITNVKFLENTNDEDVVEIEGDTEGKEGWVCPLKGLVCYEQKNFNENPETWTSSSILNGLIINHAQLRVLANIRQPDPPAGQDRELTELITFLMRMLLVLVIHIGLFFPMLAMVVAFFIRIPILWVTMAFMPLAFLGYVIGDKMGDLDTVKKIWKRFLSAAFLPLLVAIPITIGFILINAGANVEPPAAFKEFNTFIPLLASVNDFWELLWMFIAIFVLWTETFAILNKDELIGKFTTPIQNFGQNVGKLALQAPLAAPILPAPKGGDGQKTSILQQLSKFDPRVRLADINDNKRLDGSATKAPSAADERGKTIVSNGINKTNIQQSITLKAPPGTDLKDAANAKALIDDIAKKVRALTEFDKDAELKRKTNKDIVQDLVVNNASLKLDTADIDQLKTALQNTR